MKGRKGRQLWHPMVGAFLFLGTALVALGNVLDQSLLSLVERPEGIDDAELRWFGVDPEGGVLTSTDGGATWSAAGLPSSPAGMTTLGRAGDTVIAAGESGVIYRNAAEGSAFAATTSPSLLEPLSSVAPGPVDPGSGETIWMAVGPEALLRSTDDGQTWSEISYPSSGVEWLRGVAYDPTADLWVAVGERGPDEGILYESTDKGQTWSEVTPGASVPHLRAVAADGNGHFLAVGDAGTLVALSRDASTSATVLQTGTASESLATVALLADGRFLAAGEDSVQWTVEAGGGAIGQSDPVVGNGEILAALSSADGSLYLAGQFLGPSPLLLLSGEPAFGNRATNSGTVSQTLTLRNDGAANLSLDSVTGPSGNGFTSGSVQYTTGDGTAADILAPGEEATLAVTFDPAGLAVGTTFTETLSVASSAGNGTLAVQARVVDPPVLTSTAPDGEIVVGREYSYAITTNSPTGDPVELAVASGDALPGWLTLTDHGDGTATLEGTPAPADAEAGSFSFDLVATVAATGGTATEEITGEVLEPAVFGATPDPLAFGPRAVNASRELSWTLTNTGEATLKVDGITFPDGTVYSDDTSFPLLIDGDDASATVTVTFQPTAVADYSGSATFSFAHLEEVTVGLSGEGVAAPAFVTSSPPPETTEAGALFSYGVTTTGIPEGHTATITVVSGLPTWMNLQDAGDGTATLTGTPLAEQIGDAVSVELRVTDGTTGGSGTATFTTSVVAPTSASAYATSEGVDANATAPGEDPDGDGAPNLLEFALGTDPAIAGSRPVTHAAMLTVNGQTHPALHFLRRAGGTEESGSYSVDGLTYTVQGSTDLQSWTESVTATSSADTSHLPPPPTGYEWTTHHLTHPQTRGFLRVVVSE